MNVTLPSWDELDSGMQRIRFTPVQAPATTRSHSLASLHSSSSGSPNEPRMREEDERSESSGVMQQLSRREDATPQIRAVQEKPNPLAARLQRYQEAVVETSSAMDLMCGHIEHALAMDTSGGNMEEISAVLKARLANVRASATIPLESLSAGFDRMCTLVCSIAEQFFEGASTQRKLYQQELTRIQEVANMATRKAVAVQQERAASQMAQIRANLGTESAQLLEETRVKFQQCQETNRFYESEVNRLTSELKNQEKFRQELLQQHDIQAQRMVALHSENWKQKQAELEQRYAGHLDSIKTKLQNKLLDVKQKYEQQLALQRDQFAKREDDLTAERTELRKQVAELSERLAHSASGIEAMAKRQNETFMGEREKLAAFHEEKLKEAQLNHFQLLAAVKEQAANQITAVQNDALREQKRRDAVHQAELKRISEQAKLSQENVIQEVKLDAENKAHREKTLRDSEIRRLTQANQRLQRLLDQREATASQMALETPLNAMSESVGLMKDLELSTEASEEDSLMDHLPTLNMRSGAELRLERARPNPFKALRRSTEGTASDHEEERDPEQQQLQWGVFRIALKEQTDAQVGDDHSFSNGDANGVGGNHAIQLQAQDHDEFQHTSHLDSYLAKETNSLL